MIGTSWSLTAQVFKMSKLDVIQHLKIEAQTLRSMTTLNANTVTEHTARKNAELANEFEFAAEALRNIHNDGFAEGVSDGLKSLAESCKERRDKSA